MSAPRPRGYHFASAAQWKACLLSRVDASTTAGKVSIRPLAPYRSTTQPSFASDGAFAPAFSRAGAVWHDNVGQLHLLVNRDDQPEVVRAPASILRALRMIATSNDWWVATDTSLRCFDAETLSQRFTVDLAPARVIDIAADARGGIVALVELEGVLQCLHVDGVGQIGATVALNGLVDACAFAFLRGPGRFVVLSGDGERLHWFAAADGVALWRTQLATLAPCFVGDTLASDARMRVCVAGAAHTRAAPASRVLVLDADGVPIDDVALAEPATGLAPAGDSLLVTTQRGLYWLAPGDPVPDEVSETRAVLVTPVLEAPEVADRRRWLRAEVIADLPPGTTLDIACATTDDETQRDRLQALLDDVSTPPDSRLERLRAEGNWQRSFAFHGDAAAAQPPDVAFASPLYEVHDRFMWILVTLTAGAGAKLPTLSRLSVLYPGRTLMEHLPSIYQREESKPASFLRALVGVLETTTQGLDTRIAAMGSRIHPQSAAPDWLDFVARWLGLPWDDALDPDQKRCIVAHAAQIAQGRGTRAGLDTLLACLLPDAPRRFRITDFTVDHGFATLGGDACRGSALPALLGGLAPAAARLSVRATLGSMRLPCGGAEEDITSRMVGQVRVDVAASAQERARWSPWLDGVVREMVPLTARLTLRWLAIDALRSQRLDETFTLEAPAAPRLGTDAVTGRTRLPDRATGLPTSGTDAGPTLH